SRSGSRLTIITPAPRQMPQSGFGSERSVIAEPSKSITGRRCRPFVGRRRGCRRALTVRPRRPRHLRSRIPETRADLVDLQLDRRALVALAVLVGALTQTALRDDAHAFRQAPGDVLGELAPDARPKEQRIAVL